MSRLIGGKARCGAEKIEVTLVTISPDELKIRLFIDICPVHERVVTYTDIAALPYKRDDLVEVDYTIPGADHCVPIGTRTW